MNNTISNFISSQNYQNLKLEYSNSKRFVDSHFRTDDNSIYHSSLFKQNYLIHGIQWKRAKDLFLPNLKAHFVLDEENNYSNRINESNYKNFFKPTDFQQGSTGDCWFIAAASGIIQNYDLFRRIVPFDNSFQDSEYTGAFHFRFWIYGEWKDVVIDDYLPVDKYNRLIFAQNRKSPNEFWCCLLEKAYAKVNGSYEVLDGGFTVDALTDLSGGFEEGFEISKIRHETQSNKINLNSLWKILKNARQQNLVISAVIDPLYSSPNRNDRKGLLPSHAYLITKLASIYIKGVKNRIICIYNPWGNVEWKGDWSDSSDKWKLVEQKNKEILEYKEANDGQFWMSYEDWLSNYDLCFISNLTPHIKCNENQHLKKLSNIYSAWKCKIVHGQLIPGISNGGSEGSRFYINPQFGFRTKNEVGSVIICLMQKYSRQKRVALALDTAEEQIHFRVYRVKSNEKYQRLIKHKEPISKQYLEYVAASDFINIREITAKFDQLMKNCEYVIIPCCYDLKADVEFLIRIFTEIS